MVLRGCEHYFLLFSKDTTATNDTIASDKVTTLSYKASTASDKGKATAAFI